LAEKVINLTTSESKVVFKALPQDDPKQRKPDLERARELIAWKPNVQIDAGLVKTIEYFRHNLTRG
jgi:UDP-glucuronate decarboxylase